MTGRLTDAERAAASLTTPSTGLICEGRRIPCAGEIVTWLDDPKRAPTVADGAPRDADDVLAFMFHTSKGRTTTTVRPDAIPSTMAETLARYMANASREVSVHLWADTDGTIIQQADLATRTTWHAGWVNGWTVGAELVQREDAPTTLTVPQLRAAADVCDATCDALGIPRRVLVGPDGAPWVKPVRDLMSPRARHFSTGANLGGRGKTWSGVIGHCHVAHPDAGANGKRSGRGPGDPGPQIFAELIARGYARHVVDAEGRIAREPLL